jgi:hypothetical protein
MLIVFSKEPVSSSSQEPDPDDEEADTALGPLGLRQEQPARDRVSKAQKRRDKKEEREKERLAEIERQEEENKLGARHLEQEAIRARLAARGLLIHQVFLHSCTAAPLYPGYLKRPVIDHLLNFPSVSYKIV